ncbi:MAG: insulinase family protein [Proteobacteria bacterium]|nr:insulinase family protein [Pseudomonadota bacterium]
MLIFISFPAQAALFNAQSQTLENGLQVVVIENHRAPIVAHMLWVKAGSADDPYGKSGLAHYLEHLMFKGTPKYPQGEYSRRIAEVGGNENAFTSTDYTAFHAMVARQHLPLVMELESDRLANLIIDEAKAKPELAVILDERRQRVDNDPYSPLTLQMSAALFPHHPYGIPVIGWQEEMESFTPQDAQAFHARWYHPANIVLVISGDVKADEVFAMARKYYGPLAATPAITRKRVQDPAFTGEVHLRVKSPQVRERMLEYSLRAPNYRSNNAMAYALQVLGEVLDGSEAAYLPKTLIQEKKLLSRLDVSYDPDSYDPNSLSFSVVPKEGVSFEAALAGLQEALRVAAPALTPEAITRAKTSLRRAALLSRDSVMGPAYVIGEGLCTARSLEETEAWPERIASVTLEQLQKALVLINDSPHITGSIEPSENAGKAEAPVTFHPQGPIQ